MRAVVQATILLRPPDTWGVFVVADGMLPARPSAVVDAAGSRWPVTGLELAGIPDGRSVGLRITRPARFEVGELVEIV
jgi:hypothetical protein